jgi:hypothetical protein
MRECFIMAQNSCTPVSYWLSVPLTELSRWIHVNNEIVAERKQR